MSGETKQADALDVEGAVGTLKTALRFGQVPAEALEGLMADFVNVGFGREVDAFANALAIEHPTLLGQIARATALGVMRRTLGTKWRPGDRTWFEPGEAQRAGFHEPDYLVRGLCPGAEGVHPMTGAGMTVKYAEHPTHDGRLECATVVGAELMCRQSLI